MNSQQASSLLFLLLALVLAGFIGLLLYEAWTLLTKRAPITAFARLGIADHPRFAFVVAFALGLLGGHLFWR